MLDEHFSMDTQISSICRSTHFHIRNIGAIRDLLPTAAAAQPVLSLVRHAWTIVMLFILGNQHTKSRDSKEAVACPDCDHDIDEVLESLHWLPVK